MNPLSKTLCTSMALLALLLAPANALAGEAIEALKGAWVAETVGGEAPPDGVEMKMTFIDDDTIKLEVTFEGETELEEVRYEATKDGKITIWPEPEKKPEGEKATWEVKKDKKLYIVTEENETLVFARPAKKPEPSTNP